MAPGPGVCRVHGPGGDGCMKTTPLKSTIDSEVLAAQAAAIPPEKTYVSTVVILCHVREHPGPFPELSRRSDKSLKMEVSKALIRLGFVQWNAERGHNSHNNRVFARPAGLLSTPAPQEGPQLSAAGGAP